MTPEQLRASILQQAMEGKLVKQDPNDEPASILLEKITKEKARLIKEKKIKRTKKLPEVTDDEKPFEIPDSWEWVRLSEIGSWGAGATPSRSHPEYYGGNIPWLKTGDLNDGIVNETTETITEDGVENSSVKINKAGNVLIAMYGATIGKLGIAGKSMTTNQACCGCDIFEGVYNWYLFYYLLAMRATLVSMGAGGAQPNISKTKIEHFPFPLPPLAEQKRIVAKIDQIMPLVDEYAEAYDKLKKLDDGFNDKLKQSLLQYAMEGKLVKQDPNDEPASVLLEKIAEEKARLIREKKIKRTKKLPEVTDDEKPFEIPDSWEWVRLSEIGSWGAGATPSRSHPEYYGGNIPWLKTGDLNDGIVNETTETITEDGVENSSVKINKAGNVLIAMYGATIGKLGIAGKSMTTNQACCGCDIFEGVYNWYLFYYLLAMRATLVSMGAGGAQPNISKTKIEHFPFPLPPLAEQKRIVAKLDQLTAAIH